MKRNRTLKTTCIWQKYTERQRFLGLTAYFRLKKDSHEFKNLRRHWLASYVMVRRWKSSAWNWRAETTQRSSMETNKTDYSSDNNWALYLVLSYTPTYNQIFIARVSTKTVRDEISILWMQLYFIQWRMGWVRHLYSLLLSGSNQESGKSRDRTAAPPPPLFLSVPQSTVSPPARVRFF